MTKKIAAILLSLTVAVLVLSSCKASGGITVVGADGQAVFETDTFSPDKWKKESGDKYCYIKSAIEEAVNAVMENNGVSEKSAQSFLIKNNCRIVTAFDNACQSAAKDSFLKNLEDSVEFAVVLTDTSGAVMATYSNSSSGCDNTTEAKNPYSTIKPLSVYAPALEAKVINWSSMFEDSEYKKITGQDGGIYSWPVNATNRYENKDVSVGYGVKQSLNTVAVKCLSRFGVKKSISFLRSNFGINLDDESRKAEIYGDEEILGNIAMGYLSRGVSVVDMAGYYSIFVNGGEYVRPYFVSSITDASGNELLNRQADKKQVISRVTANIMNRMLREVVSVGGTGEKAAVDGVEICGKTGTGNNNEGNWFVGFSPNYICAVWHGSQMRDNTAPQVFSGLFSSIPQKISRFPKYTDISQMAYCAQSGKLLSEKCKKIEAGYFSPDNMPGICDIIHK